jgi:spermidine/putrescine transport system permease protein
MTARTGTWLLMLPGLLWLGLLMIVPCLLVFVLIFFERGVYGGIDWQAPTLENVTRVFDPLYLSIFCDSASLCSLAIRPPMPSPRRPRPGKPPCCSSPSCHSGPIT